MTANAAFQKFTKETYLNLETYRKSGQEMRTPVWFIAADEKLYIRTVDNSGKVKRIRRNPVVKVAPCEAQGKLKGEWVDGTASLISGDKAEEINRLLNKKYGLLKYFLDFTSRLRGYQYTTIMVELSA